MSPSGLAQTAPKETSGNTDFCYYVADRITPRPTRFIYACTDTPICISSTRETCEQFEYSYFAVIIIYIGLPSVPFVIIAAALLRPYAVTSDKIQSRPFRQMKPLINGRPRSIRSNRHNRDTRLKNVRYIWPLRNFQLLFDSPLRRQYFILHT